MKLLIAGIFLLLIGFLMIAFPGKIYAVTQSWKNSTEDEPSDLYKVDIRIGGVICSFIGIVSIIVCIVL